MKSHKNQASIEVDFEYKLGERSRHMMGNGLLTQDPVSSLNPAVEQETESGGRLRSQMISSTQPPESAFGMKDAQHESDSGTSLQQQDAMSRIAVDTAKHVDARKHSEPTLDEFKNKNAQL